MYKLEWDSIFWGIDVYNLNEDYIFDISMLNDKLSKEWLIQALIPENKIGVINQLEDKGFRFVETKVNLIKKAENTVVNLDNVFKKVNYQDLEVYKNEFGNLYGKFSRFRLLNEKKINEFYYLWLVNTIAGKMDDICVGYYIKEKLVGFITYRLKNDEFSIGLIGVFSEFQRQGISQKLLDWINNEAIDKGYNFINVSTQGENYNAINTYIKNGYTLKNIENWYYLRGK